MGWAVLSVAGACGEPNGQAPQDGAGGTDASASVTGGRGGAISLPGADAGAGGVDASDAGADASAGRGGAGGGSPDAGFGLPPIPLDLERRDVRSGLRVQKLFAPAIGLFDGEQWRGITIATWAKPRLLYADGDAITFAGVQFNQPIDFSQSTVISGTARTDKCVLEALPAGGGPPMVLCDRGHHADPTGPAGTLRVTGLVRWAKAAPAVCVLDQAGLRCFSACQTAGYPCRYAPDILGMVREFGGRPLDFAIEEEHGCVLGEASPGQKEVRCFGNSGASWTNAFRAFGGDTFVRAGVSADICMLSADRSDMRCGASGLLDRKLRGALFEGRADARIDDVYVGESVHCVRVRDRVGCRSSIQGDAPVLVELPPGELTGASSTLAAAVSREGYRVCLAVGGRLRCKTIAHAAPRADGSPSRVAGALEDVPARELGTPGVEWIASTGPALGCLRHQLWRIDAGEPVRSWGVASCGAVVPRAALAGAFVLRTQAIATIADAFIPALAESERPVPSEFEEIVHIDGGGRRTNVRAPGLLASSYAVSFGPSGALYYLSHRPKAREGDVKACAGASPGCPERVSFASELLRLSPRASGGFDPGAEILFAGDDVVGFGFEPGGALVVAQSRGLVFRNGRYEPQDVRTSRVPGIVLR